MSCGVLRRLPKEAAWRKLLLAGTALTAVTTCTTGHAADWTGAVSTNWFDAGNWSTNAVPSGFEPAIINTTSPNAPLISGGLASSIAGWSRTWMDKRKTTLRAKPASLGFSHMCGIGG